MVFICIRCIWFCGCISFIHKYLNVLVCQLSVVQILQRERYLYKPVHHLKLAERALFCCSLVHKHVLHVGEYISHAQVNTPDLADADFQVAGVAVFRYQHKVYATRSGNSRVGINHHARPDCSMRGD